MSLLPPPERERLRSQYPEVFARPASARLATPAMISGAAAIFLFGLVDLDFSPARLVAGFHQLGWITMMMIPPDPGSSLPAYLVALGETLSIALLGTTIGALVALPVSLLAARNIVPSGIFRFPVRRFLDSIRGVDTLIWALVWINVVGLGPFAGVLAIAISRLRRVRQTVLRGDRDCRQEAGRGYPGVRRQCAARDTIWPDAAGAARDRRAGALFHRVRTRVRRPSSASSAPAASACNWPSRSGCWSGRRCRS